MKLYRIRYKKSFVTAMPIEEIEWTGPAPMAAPMKLHVVPGLKKELCEIIPARWIEKRVTVPEHTEDVEQVTPAYTYLDHELVPGYFKTKKEYVQGHYETKEIWIPEHEEQKLVEIPGYYESRTVQEPGEWVETSVWKSGYWESYLVTRPADPSTGRLEVSYEDKRWVEGRYYTRKVWVEGRTRLVKFWVDATWEMRPVMVPGAYRDHRVWIEGEYKDVQVWVEPQIKQVTIIVPEKITIIAVRVKETVERQPYWQEEQELCWMVTGEDRVVDEAGIDVIGLVDLTEWFDWYVGTQHGLVFVDLAKASGWFRDWSQLQVMQKAWDMLSPVGRNPSVAEEAEFIIRANVERAHKFLEHPEWMEKLKAQGRWEEVRRIEEKWAKTPTKPLTPEEIAFLKAAGVLAAMIAAAALVMYYTWPGAKYDFKVTYTDWVYVLRYQENFQYADLVGVSGEGNPYLLGCPKYGGPIMNEERSYEKDLWHFGEAWEWSAYIEEGRWMGLAETRYWYEAEVEYLGMVSRTGARFYMMYSGKVREACAGHEPGWVKDSRDWGEWEEEWWHERI